MIHGIGTDLVVIRRIEDALSRFGDRFLRRILDQTEVNEYAKSAQPVRFLAKRFAVKEAFSKAYGTGIGDTVGWHDVTVSHDKLGRPLIQTSARLNDLLLAQGITEKHLTITDETEHALAFVVLEKY